MELRAILPNLNLRDRYSAARAAVFRSVALARSGRLDEARELIGSELRFLRDTERRNVDDASIRLLLSQALYAAGLTAPANEARAALAESQALFDDLPPDMRSARTVRWWGDRIGQAQRSAR